MPVNIQSSSGFGFEKSLFPKKTGVNVVAMKIDTVNICLLIENICPIMLARIIPTRKLASNE